MFIVTKSSIKTGRDIEHQVYDSQALADDAFIEISSEYGVSVDEADFELGFKQVSDDILLTLSES